MQLRTACGLLLAASARCGRVYPTLRKNLRARCRPVSEPQIHPRIRASDTAALPAPRPDHTVNPMGSRGWIKQLAEWIWSARLTRDEVARRSKHDVGYVLALFSQANPNPSLRLYLDLLEAAGARMATVGGNTVRHVIGRINELRKAVDLSVTALAKRAGLQRSHLSRILNDDNPNMQLAVFDALISALGAEEEMRLVARYQTSKSIQLALTAGGETATATTTSRPTVPPSTAPRHLHVVSSDDEPPPASHDALEALATATEEAERRARAAEQRARHAETRAAVEKTRADAAVASVQEARARADAAAKLAEQEKSRADMATREAAYLRTRLERAKAEAKRRGGLTMAEASALALGVPAIILGGAYLYDRHVKARKN